MTSMRNLLVLYTGGTIGMRRGAHGYEPVTDYLEEKLATFPQLHDPSQSHFTTLPSRSGLRIHYDVRTYSPLLDSANLGMPQWKRFATDIISDYDNYDGFVILHGTDTMAFSASAMSFMLEGLSKPVILTGAQIPLENLRNDALDNLLGALGVGGHYDIPEVGLYFHHKLLRGNRSTKIDASGLDAFASPNYPPLVEVGVDVKVNQSIIRPIPTGTPTLRPDFSAHVASLRLYPGITPKIVDNFLQAPLEGLVLETYGRGNAPDADKELLRTIRRAHDRGLVMVNVTQCLKGHVTASYAAGQALADAGVLPGADMTPEAALTKLAFLLGQESNTTEIQRKMTIDLRGELSPDAK